jgi:hypothetical protein
MTDKSVFRVFRVHQGTPKRYRKPRRWTIKIYTRTGDQGKTSLFSGERVSKADKRLEACGDVDELNAVLGALAASLDDEDPKLVREIQEIQSTLFHVGVSRSLFRDSLPAALHRRAPLAERGAWAPVEVGILVVSALAGGGRRRPQETPVLRGQALF